jgi:hypothetical protein
MILDRVPAAAARALRCDYVAHVVADFYDDVTNCVVVAEGNERAGCR